MTSDWQNWQIIATGVAGVVTSLVGIVTYLWRQKQERAWRINEQFQTDSHTLRLCEALSNPSPQLRLAAAALLLERLKQFGKSPVSERNQSAIIQALIAATVGTDRNRDETSVVLSKFIADEVVKALDGLSNRHKMSPLRHYYWQRACLVGAYWKGVDARGADFFGCDFRNASLRRANLQDAVFYEASLEGATLAGANLKGANFTDANLCGTNLADDARAGEEPRKTEWTGAKFAGARYDDKTQFPAGFEPQAQGMRLAGAAAERELA